MSLKEDAVRSDYKITDLSEERRGADHEWT